MPANLSVGVILNLQLPRQPAFAELRPKEALFNSVRDAMADRICEALGQGCVAQISGGHRYYLHSNNDTSSFVKLVKADDLKRFLQADEVATHVVSQGVQSSLIRAGFPRPFDDESFLLVYDYIPSRFAEANGSDIKKLGALIARMHLALKSVPNQERALSATRVRLATLEARASRIVAGDDYGPDPDLLRQIVCQQEGLLKLFSSDIDAQCTHGDLNYSNVIFDQRDGAACLLDFEDTMISWFPPAFDVALALERFVLTMPLSDSAMYHLGTELLISYKREVAQDSEVFSHGLHEYLHALALRSLLTLAELSAREVEPDVAEWRKFSGLYALTVSQEPLLKKMQSSVQ